MKKIIKYTLHPKFHSLLSATKNLFSILFYQKHTPQPKVYKVYITTRGLSKYTPQPKVYNKYKYTLQTEVYKASPQPEVYEAYTTTKSLWRPQSKVYKAYTTTKGL